MVDLDIAFGIDLLEFLADIVCEILGVSDQRETLSIPDPFVKFGRFRWPERKDEAVENDLPFPSGKVDHPRITKEIAQILAQGACSRSFRRTKLHENHFGFALGRDVI